MLTSAMCYSIAVLLFHCSVIGAIATPQHDAQGRNHSTPTYLPLEAFFTGGNYMTFLI